MAQYKRRLPPLPCNDDLLSGLDLVAAAMRTTRNEVARRYLEQGLRRDLGGAIEALGPSTADDVLGAGKMLRQARRLF